MHAFGGRDLQNKNHKTRFRHKNMPFPSDRPLFRRAGAAFRIVFVLFPVCVFSLLPDPLFVCRPDLRPPFVLPVSLYNSAADNSIQKSVRKLLKRATFTFRQREIYLFLTLFMPTASFPRGSAPAMRYRAFPFPMPGKSNTNLAWHTVKRRTKNAIKGGQKRKPATFTSQAVRISHPTRL